MNYDAFVARLDANGVLQWNTFLGGSMDDQGQGIALDGEGNVYLVGYSGATWGAPLRSYSGGQADAFAARLDSSGALQWNTFLGGSDYDLGKSIAVDGAGNVFVAGYSSSSWGSPVRGFIGGFYDAFAARLNSSGALQWNTFLGGSGDYDYGEAITVDASGNIYVAGSSSAAWGSPLRDYTGSDDAYIARLDANGALQWNTFLGGDYNDAVRSIAVDGAGNIYAGGMSTFSWGTPYLDYGNALVARLDSSGTLQWHTFLGGEGYAIAVDWGGNIYTAGYSNSTWGAPVRPYAGSYDASVAKLLDMTGSPPASFAKSAPANAGTNVSTGPTLSWGPSSAATRYEYCYDTTNDNACSAWTSNKAAISKVLAGLNPNTTYYWHVRAKNNLGTIYADGSATAFWSFITMDRVNGVDIDPPTEAKHDDPGATVSYTLDLTNTGNTADTFDIAVSGNAWTTNTPATVGPIAAGDSQAVNISVTIPPSAAGGSTDTATITATSQADNTKTDSSTLNTTANNTYGVTVGPATNGKSGSPGSTVSYSLNVTNNGNTSDTFDIAVSGNTWTTNAPATIGPLAAGASQALNVNVTIPTTASNGSTDTATITVTSQGDNTRSDIAVLTTTAGSTSQKLYLPMIRNNSGTPSSEDVGVINAFTTDAAWNPKTTFTSGEPIKWVLSIENRTQSAQSIEITYDVRGPNNEAVAYWNGTVTTGTGIISWGLDGVVPSGMAGTHTFNGQGLYQGYLSQVFITYQVISSAIMFR